MKRNLRVITNNALFNKKASWLFGVLLLVCLIIPVAAMASSAKASFVANYAPAAGMDSSENGELLACFQSGKPVVINRSTGVVEDVAVSSSGEKGNGNYVATISLSKDGRYVVFASNASNLAPGVDPGQTSTGYCNIFLRDRKTHETVLVSRSYTGFPNGGSGITRNAISDDGKYIVFWSDASNLTPDDTNGVSDVYIYDVGSGLLRLISLDGNGEASAQGSSCAIISGDGKSVAYATGSYGLNTVFSSDWKSQSIPVIAPGTQGTMGGAPVAFSKDGKKLLCDYQSDTLYDMWDHYYIIYDLAQGTRLVRSRTPSGNSMGSGATDISSDGRFIVLADDYQLYQSDKGYRVIDWLNNKEYSFGELDSSYKGSSNYGAPAIFSGDGRLLFFSSQTQVYNSWGIFVTLLSGLNTTSTTISKDEFAVFVREKASGMPISGASVTVGGTVFTTDSTGKASVKGKFGTQVVSVTAPGYQSQARSETIKLGTGVFFLLDPASNMPTVSQALLNGKTDLKCVGNGPVYTVGDTTRARIKVTADWKNYKPGLYIISQAGRVPVNSTTGDFNFLPGQVFDADKSIYLQLQGTDPATGQTVMSQHYDLHLRMQKPAAGLFGSSVRVGSKMQFDIPKDIPVVGGAPMDFDLKFVPFSLDIEGNRIRVGLGCSDVGRMKENWDEFVNISDTLAKNQKDATKSLAALDELKQYGFKASKLDLMDNIKPKADFNVFGYMEGYIDSKGNPVFSQGYAVLGLDLKASYTQQFVVGPVPAYIKVAVGLEIQKQLNCGTMQDNHLLYTGDLTLTPKGSLEGGVGVKGVCSIGAEGEIKLPVTINTAQNYQTIEWKGTAKLIVGAFEPFVYKYKFAEGGGVLYDSRKQGAKVSGSAAPMSGAAAPTGMPTLDEFKLASRSDGEWKAISAAKPSAQSASGMQGAPAPLASAAPGFTTLQTGTMSSSKPQMIAVGNKLLAVWQEDNSARSSINRSMLVYSVKSAGAWSAPQAVWDNGAPDGTAQLFTDGSKVWLVWQKAKSSISVADETDSATVIPAYAAAQEIATAQWDTATSTFSSKSYLTNDSTLDLLPSGVMIQGTPTVSWVSNSANDIFGSSGTNTIKTATLDGSSWDIKTIATASKPVLESQVGADGSTADVAYTLDGDGNLTTTDDVDLYLNQNGVQTQVTHQGLCPANPQFSGNKLYWVDSTLESYDLTTGLIVPVFGTDTVVNTGYQLASVGGKTAVVWTATQDDGSSAVQGRIIGGDGTFNLAQSDKSLSWLSVSADSSGSWSLLSLASSTDNATGDSSSDLDFFQGVAPKDVSLDSASLDYDARDAAGAVPLAATLTNNGQDTATGISLDVKDSAGATLQSVPVSQSIAGGASLDFSSQVELPLLSTPTTYTVEVAYPGDTDSSNNTQACGVGASDLAVTVDQYDAEDSVVLNTLVTNNNTTPASGQLVIREAKEGGQVIETHDIDTLTQGDSVLFTTTVPRTEDAPDGPALFTGDNPDGEPNAYVVEVITSDQETLVGNNQQTVILSTETTTAPTELTDAPATVAVQSVAVDDPVSLAALTSDDIGRVLYLNYLTTPANASDQDATWTSSDSDVLSVGDDGVATVKGLGTATVTVTTDDGAKKATAQVKVSPTTAQVTFKNGDQTIGTLTYAKGDALNTQLLPVPTEAGKAFAGWSLSAGGAVINTKTTVVSGDLTLYALWVDGGSTGGDPSVNMYDINYNLNGGLLPPFSALTYVSGTPTLLPTPVREGYLFRGWYDNEACQGDAVVILSDTSIGDRTFWALWAPDITASMIKLPATSYVFTGAAIKPAVTVVSGGVTLVAGKDYTVSYGTNTAVGTGSVTVSAVNDLMNVVTVNFTIVPATPALASLANSATGPLLKWNKAAGATGYYVLRKTGTGAWVNIKTIAAAATVSYTDTTAVSGTTYSYSVQAYGGTNSLAGSYNTTGKTITYVATPKLTSAVNVTTGVKFTWGKVSGATGYLIYRKTGTGTFALVKTITSAATVSWIDTTAKSGTTYTYTAYAYKTTTANKSACNATGKKVVYVATPKLVSLANSKSGPVFKWGKVTGATGYIVLRKTTGGWSTIATIKSGSTVFYTDKKAVKGKTYSYTVRAYKTSTANVSAYNATGKKIKVKK